MSEVKNLSYDWVCLKIKLRLGMPKKKSALLRHSLVMNGGSKILSIVFLTLQLRKISGD